LPLDPTVGYGSIQVNVAAPRTFPFVVLKGCTLMYDDTHFENHFWFNRAGYFRAFDCLAIFGTEDLIVASLYKTISWAIFTVSADDIVKDLTC
jgi:hypothetical protein